MLSIAVARSADYYARLAQVGYYTAAPEKPGAWYGKGAERLLFTGEISDLSAFKKVFEGLHPEGGKLVQNAGKENRKNAWYLTFSAPKSFSVLWAIANETDRKVLESIERRAVESALNEATNHVVTRTGKGGVVRERCDLIFALFPHSTSRAEEPQRHTHCLLMNIGVRANGKTGALETADLFRMKMTLGALYRAELSRLMEHEYGISFERVKNSIELLGRDKPLCEFYSTRSKEIESFMKENGLQGATLAAKACTKTRSKKDMEKGIDEHLSRWSRETEELGVTY
jgi:conjugative relaxase-like TrwC/TraI family protein